MRAYKTGNLGNKPFYVSVVIEGMYICMNEKFGKPLLCLCMCLCIGYINM